jgi:hypothetical protein
MRVVRLRCLERNGLKAGRRKASRQREEVRFASDSPLEGDGFEPSIPRVMGGDLERQVPALIAIFELAGTAVALQRGTKVVWPHRHPEFP